MDSFNTLYYILITLAMAELAIQIVISDLSHLIKGVMLLQQPYNKKLQAVGSTGFWRRLLGYGWVIATPFILLAVIHHWISKMLDCPFCIGFHLCWLANYFVLGMSVPQALLLAPIGLIVIALLDKIHCG